MPIDFDARNPLRPRESVPRGPQSEKIIETISEPSVDADYYNPGGAGYQPPEPKPSGSGVSSAGASVLPSEIIGDIPPPPIPTPPVPKTVGSGVGGVRGTEAGTLSLPGTAGAKPFRSAAFQPVRPRFGPGVPMAGGGTDVSGLDINPDDAAELLRELARGRM